MVVASGRARRASPVTAAPRSLAVLPAPKIKDRDVLLGFVAGLVIALCWREAVTRALADFPDTLLDVRTGFGAAELLALGVLAFLVLRLGREEVLTNTDLAVIAVAGLAFALPMKPAAAVPLAAVGVKLVLHKESRISSIGQVLLALAAYEWFGPALFHLAAPYILEAEAFVLRMGLEAFDKGFSGDGLRISAPNWPGIEVEEGCSAFHNVSLSALIWISLLKLETLSMRPVYVVVAAAAAGATMILNTIRLALIAQSPEMYHYWHEGAGVAVMSFIMLAVALAVCLGGMRLARR